MKESIYKHYTPEVLPSCDINEEDIKWFIFDGSRLLVKGCNITYFIPKTADLTELNIKTRIYLGKLDGKPCFAGELDSTERLPENLHFGELRSFFGQIDDSVYLLAGKAVQIINWNNNHRYCGRCGEKTEDKCDERAKICKSCNTVVYPTICPAIIVSVEDGERILLAHAAHFKNNMYSVIAGFVEPGETLEDCVGREVKEEVGIEIKNIKYFTSQPWPYPNSLMIAFTAEYAGGELKIDNDEIDDAGWYTVNNLPDLPNSISVSKRLIDYFIERHT